jgi:hypothetical protein
MLINTINKNKITIFLKVIKYSNNKNFVTNSKLNIIQLCNLLITEKIISIIKV